MTATALKLPTHHNDSEMSFEVVTVTPTMAEAWLGKNRHNRNVRPQDVIRYARAMSNGEWMLTGEALKFSADGSLVDGQHRLLAVIEAGRPVTFLVIKGLPSSVQDVLDTGRARTAGDQLAIHGYANPTTAAAAARVALLYESDRFYTERVKKAVSHREILDFCEGNSLLAFATSRSSQISKSVDVRPSIAAMTFYELLKVDSDAAVEFFDRLSDGANLPTGSPILALRARARALRGERARLPDEALVSMVFRTWNAWRKNRRLTLLPIYQDGQLIRCPKPL